MNHNTSFVRPRGAPVGSEPGGEWVDHLTIYTHFDSASSGSVVPTTSSRDLLALTGLTAQDPTIPTHQPTVFQHIFGILLKPFRPQAYNAFPLRTVAGLAQALSIRNAQEQEKTWAGDGSDGRATLALAGFGKWKRRGEAAELINSLCETPHSSMNLSFSMDLRCDREEKSPGLAEVEAFVRLFIARYVLFVYQILYPVTPQETALRTSLVGHQCNPEINVTIVHPWQTPQSVKIVAATDGESVEVLYEGIADEHGALGCCQRFGLVDDDDDPESFICKELDWDEM